MIDWIHHNKNKKKMMTTMMALAYNQQSILPQRKEKNLVWKLNYSQNRAHFVK